MTVSIVIPHYGEQQLVEAALASIWKYTAMEVEVVVVDNGTGHPIDADQVIRNTANVGFAAACNQGAAIAGGEHLVFLNNDCEVRDLWLEPLVDQLERGAGIVGALLLYPDGQVQHAGVRLHRNAEGTLVAENRRQHYAGGDLAAVTGACLAIHADLFAEVDGFDEGYMNGYEDVDLCLKVGRTRRVVYEPACVVTHGESRSGAARWTHVRQNVARLQERWGDLDV